MEKQAHSLSINQATRQDWPVIEEMFADAFRADIYFPLMKRKLDIAKIVSLFSTSISALFVGQVYILRSNSRPAGFIMLKKTGEKLMHLHYMAVAPQFRRQGLGRDLVVFALKVACEHGVDISLEAETDSFAMRLYRSLGFSVDNHFHIYSLVPTSAPPSGQESAVELIPVEDSKSMLTVAKEWLLGYRSSGLTCNREREAPLVFRYCKPVSGSSDILHCSLSNGYNELLHQILPHLAFRTNTPAAPTWY